MGDEETSAKNCGNVNFELDLCFFLTMRQWRKEMKLVTKETTFVIKRVLWQILSFFFALTHTHGHSRWVGKRDTRRVLLVLLHGFILVFSFFLSPWLLAFRFQRIKWHEIKSYYENFCAAFAGKREKL